MKITNYLIFDEGLCEEAFALYHQVLGGTLEITRFSKLGMPSPEGRDYILHAHLIAHGIELMGSDNGLIQEFKAGNALSLHLVLPNAHKAQEVVGRFGEHAEVIMPFSSNSHTQGYAYLRDKFDVAWHISVESGKRALLPYVVEPREQTTQLMEYYQKIFGGELSIVRFSDINPDYPDGKNLVAKARLHNGQMPFIIGSDLNPDTDEVSLGFSVAFNLTVYDLEEGRDYFEQLAKDGRVIVAYGASPWSSGFGILYDAYGFHWQINFLDI